MRCSCGCALVSTQTLPGDLSLKRFWFTAYLAPDKTGLAQDGFTCVCNACRFVVTREKLVLAKLVGDLVKDPKNFEDVGRYRDAVYLP